MTITFLLRRSIFRPGTVFNKRLLTAFSVAGLAALILLATHSPAVAQSLLPWQRLTPFDTAIITYRLLPTDKNETITGGAKLYVKRRGRERALVIDAVITNNKTGKTSIKKVHTIIDNDHVSIKRYIVARKGKKEWRRWDNPVWVYQEAFNLLPQDEKKAYKKDVADKNAIIDFYGRIKDLDKPHSKKILGYSCDTKKGDKLAECYVDGAPVFLESFTRKFSFVAEKIDTKAKVPGKFFVAPVDEEIIINKIMIERTYLDTKREVTWRAKKAAGKEVKTGIGVTRP